MLQEKLQNIAKTADLKAFLHGTMLQRSPTYALKGVKVCFGVAISTIKTLVNVISCKLENTVSEF